MQFTFGDKIEVYLLDKSATYDEKDSKQEGKRASALGWNIDTQTLMSWQHHFVEGLSNKKAELYYCKT